jgi:hypothetical protein
VDFCLFVLSRTILNVVGSGSNLLGVLCEVSSKKTILTFQTMMVDRELEREQARLFVLNRTGGADFGRTEFGRIPFWSLSRACWCRGKEERRRAKKERTLKVCDLTLTSLTY